MEVNKEQVKEEVANAMQQPNPMRVKAQELYGAELVAFLKTVHPSDAHILIKENISQSQIKELRLDPTLYKEYNAIRKNAMASYDYDHKGATMMDVNRACMNVYSILLRMIGEMNKDMTLMKERINELEAKNGLEQTIWVPEPVEQLPVEPSDDQIIEKADNNG